MRQRGVDERVHLECLLTGPLRYDNHSVWLHQLVWSPWGYGVSVPGPNDAMSFALGPIHLAALVLVLVLLARRIPPPGLAGPLAALTLLAAYLTTGYAQWLWDALPLLQYLEFPYLAVNAVGPAPLVLHTAAFPGWQLEVGSQPQLLVRSSPEDLVVVDLDGGSHDLWLRFGPTPLRTASASLSALSALLLLAGVPRRWRQ